VEVVAERGHSRAAARAVKCGTENERTDMTNVIAKPLIVPANQAWKKSARPMPVASLGMPVTPQNRSRLRALRQAEMAAWNATAGAGFDTGQFERTQVVEKERRDLRAFGLIATLAITTVMISLLKSSAFVEQWTGFVNLVRQLIG